MSKDCVRELTKEGYYLSIFMDGETDMTSTSFWLRLFPQWLSGGNKTSAILVEKLARSMPSKAVEERLLELEEMIRDKDEAVIAMLQERGRTVSEWIQMSHTRRVQQAALPETTTCSQWVNCRKAGENSVFHEKISNLVYSAELIMTKEVSRRNQKKTAWSVTYSVMPNCAQLGARSSICGISQKRYKDETKAVEYYNGRKKWLEKKFFYCQAPDIPPEFERHFLMDGAKLPIYNYVSDAGVENQKQENS